MSKFKIHFFRRNLWIVCFVCSIGLCFSQKPTSTNDFWNNVRFGGGIGLGFGNGNFNGAISPSAIYQATNEFAIGTSLSLNYASFRNSNVLAYGGSVLALFNPIPIIQVSAEFEELRVNRTVNTVNGRLEDNFWSPALFLGLGYSTRNVTIGLRYDLLYDETTSINPNALTPFVRVYF